MIWLSQTALRYRRHLIAMSNRHYLKTWYFYTTTPLSVTLPCLNAALHPTLRKPQACKKISINFLEKRGKKGKKFIFWTIASLREIFVWWKELLKDVQSEAVKNIWGSSLFLIKKKCRSFWLTILIQIPSPGRIFSGPVTL